MLGKRLIVARPVLLPLLLAITTTSPSTGLFAAAAAGGGASRYGFSVYDDLLAHPQFEIIFSSDLIPDSSASALLAQTSDLHLNHDRSDEAAKDGSIQATSRSSRASPDAKATHELMVLHSQPYLCNIPIIAPPPPTNETSEAEARMATQKELVRASSRGWELLSPLEGSCLYFISGWWSYQFCYNGEVTQFHQLSPQPGRPPYPPKRDPTTPEFTLGKVRATSGRRGRAAADGSDEDEWGNRLAIRKSHGHSAAGELERSDLQIKGGTRYLVQKMDGGSICDLTGRPRQIEVQYQCMPQIVGDRIGFVKEVTTCSYLMVVHTPRLCSDAAFLPPKKEEAHKIVCSRILGQGEDGLLKETGEGRVVLGEAKVGADAAVMKQLGGGAVGDEEMDRPTTIGGILVGGGQFVGRDGHRMPVPPLFAHGEGANGGNNAETIAMGKPRAEGGEVAMISEDAMERLEIDPELVEELRREVQELAREKGWKIEIVDDVGEGRGLVAIVDEDEMGDEEEDGEAPMTEARLPEADVPKPESQGDGGESSEHIEEGSPVRHHDHGQDHGHDQGPDHSNDDDIPQDPESQTQDAGEEGAASEANSDDSAGSETDHKDEL